MSNNKIGISAIVCTYNGAATISNTLISLLDQKVEKDHSYEVIVVNNNSNDHTVDILNKFKNEHDAGHPISLKILSEPRPGKNFAQEKGILNASYEYLIIVDDDNVLKENYFETVYDCFEKQPFVGVINGSAFLPDEPAYKDLPFWWDDFRKTFAVFNFGEKELKVDKVWGAGMAIRKVIFDTIYQNEELKFQLTCRVGDSYSSGGDTEHCYIARLFGYQIKYLPDLSLVHHIAIHRFTDNDLKKLYTGIGNSKKIINAFKSVLKGKKPNYFKEIIYEKLQLWVRKLLIVFYKISRNEQKLFKHQVKYITEMASLNSLKKMDAQDYNKICKEINNLKNYSLVNMK